MCGKEIEADAKFCPYCGAKVEIPTQDQPETEAHINPEGSSGAGSVSSETSGQLHEASAAARDASSTQDEPDPKSENRTETLKYADFSGSVKDAAQKTGDNLKKFTQAVTEGSKSLYSDMREGMTGESVNSLKESGMKGLANNFHLVSLIGLICAALSLISVALPYLKIDVLFYSGSYSLPGFKRLLESFDESSGGIGGLIVELVILALIEVVIILICYRKKKLATWAQFVLAVVSVILLLDNIVNGTRLRNFSSDIGGLSLGIGFYLIVIMQLIFLFLVLLYMILNQEGFFGKKKAK
jgi:hypothetical protein